MKKPPESGNSLAAWASVRRYCATNAGETQASIEYVRENGVGFQFMVPGNTAVIASETYM